MTEGMAAALSNAWINGHGAVGVGDLDVLQHMWWILQDEIPTVQKLVLGATNPGEKRALELFDDLNEQRAEIKRAEDQDLDDTKKRLVAMETYKVSRRVVEEADELEAKALAAGAGTQRIVELRGRAQNLMEEVSTQFFS